MKNLREKILEAKTISMQRGKIPEITVVIHPNDLVDLFEDRCFIDISAYNSKTSLLSGEIGRIYGAKVFLSSHVKEGNPKIGIENSKQLSKSIENENFNPSKRDNYV